ncbi:MAG: aminopeptidase [Erysipelotrichaceae bacterium]
MNFPLLIDKYAKLAVYVGANVQKDQIVILNTNVECVELNRAIVRHAYEAGAKLVSINYRDEIITKHHYTHQSVETLCDIPEWLRESRLDYVRQGACIINVVSNYPGNLKDIDPTKIAQASMASQVAFKEQSEYTMANKTQWSIVAASNPVWAKTVFPDVSEEEASVMLWEAIFKASRVSEDNDPVQAWVEHNDNMARYEHKMNEMNFKSLHFTNALGTDLHVSLVDQHIWAGGNETTKYGVVFNPNIPTEEVFTMPEKFGVNGRVYSSKPLDYQGKLIDRFYLDFKDGKVVGFDAEVEKEALEALVTFDEGASYLGEVALVPFDSPISNSNLLFNNTLFDENASCHLALGRAYPMNVKEGTEMSEEQLIAAGANQSKLHVDFMFGTSDLQIIGTKQDGTQVTIFKDGNFVF